MLPERCKAPGWAKSSDAWPDGEAVAIPPGGPAFLKDAGPTASPEPSCESTPLAPAPEDWDSLVDSTGTAPGPNADVEGSPNADVGGPSPKAGDSE